MSSINQLLLAEAVSFRFTNSLRAVAPLPEHPFSYTGSLNVFGCMGEWVYDMAMSCLALYFFYGSNHLKECKVNQCCCVCIYNSQSKWYT